MPSLLPLTRSSVRPDRILPVVMGVALVVLGARLPGAAHGQSGGALAKAAAGFHELFLHDVCTGDYAPQPDTCLHEQLVEKPFTFGGQQGTTYDVRLRIRGIFEPTTIRGLRASSCEYAASSRAITSASSSVVSFAERSTRSTSPEQRSTCRRN